MTRTGTIELHILAVLAAVGPRTTTVYAPRGVQTTLIHIRTGVTDQREHRVEHRHLDTLSAASALTRDKRHDDAGCGEERREVRCQRYGRIERSRPVPVRWLLT